MRVQLDRIARDLEIINSFTTTPGSGITRFTFTEPYLRARAHVAEELQKTGARVATTVGGNLCGRLAGSTPGFPSVMTGSHIDSVLYAAAMQAAGLTPQIATLLRPGMVKAMVELHIEQSLVLESKGVSIGVVEGINGIKQFGVTLTGIPNHAGATPMGLRHDALQGAARVIAAVEEIAAAEMGGNTVATVGMLSCEPGQANVIPGRVQVTIDIRDLDSERIDQAVRRIMSVIEATRQARGLACEI